MYCLLLLLPFARLALAVAVIVPEEVLAVHAGDLLAGNDVAQHLHAGAVAAGGDELAVGPDTKQYTSFLTAGMVKGTKDRKQQRQET